MSDTEHADLGPDTGHDYDGIRELDNRLPNWWLATLFGAMFFAGGYWFYFHQLGAPGLVERHKMAEAEAAAKAAAGAVVDDKLLLALSHDAKSMAAAKTTFTQVCSTCHGLEGEGKVGPNLTDDSWIHGGKPLDNYNTIAKGVIQKAMPAWEPILGREKVMQMAAYVETLRGKHLPGKPAEGEKLAQ